MAMTSRARPRLFAAFLLIAPALSVACHRDDRATHPLAPPDRPSPDARAPAITYDLEVNTRDDFDATSVAMMIIGLTEPQHTTTALSAGHYFWRVVARAASNPDDRQLSLNDRLFVDVP